MKFRKKPLVIAAIQWTGTNEQTISAFIGTPEPVISLDTERGVYVYEIPTLEGVMRADEGDWIIRGVMGECYPCKPDIFETTYEPTDEPLSVPGDFAPPTVEGEVAGEVSDAR